MADDFLDTDENTALEDSNQSTEYDDLIGYIDKKFTTAKTARYTDEARWFSPIETIEVSMVLTLSLQMLRSLVSLLR